MRKAGYDKIFLWTVAVLLLAGVFILSSASMGLLARKGPDFYDAILNQIGFGIIGGLAALYVTSKIDYKKWRRFALPLFVFTFLFSLLVFVPGISFMYGGARRWIKIASFTFQPSEFLKFGFIVYLSAWLTSIKSNIKSFKFGLLPFLIIIALVSLILIKEPDIGTLGVIAITSLLLFFLGGGKFTQIALMIIIGIIALGVLSYIEPYRMDRIKTFLNPSIEPSGISYQLRQSLIALGSGGILGRGFGMSVQKFNYLPEPIGDSIFAVFGEEFGFVGSVLLVALFLFFLYRGFRISLRAPDDFGKLLGAGIILLIMVECLINIASMTGIIPLTGLPLIFVSKGGSSLLITLAQIGILLNISKRSKL